MAYTILVPVDSFDEHITELAHMTNNMCLHTDSKLILLHVVPDLEDINLEEVDQQLDDANELLEDFAALLACSSENIQYSIQMGQPASEILKRAIIDRVDAIALPTRGKTAINRLLLGSVAEHVMRHAHCPVITTRKISDVKEPGDKEIKRILVPLDGTAQSASIIPTVKQFAKAHKSEITLFYDERGSTEDQVTSAIKNVDQTLDMIQQHLIDAGIKVSIEKSNHKAPADEIARKVEELDIDLVAMTTHGRTGLARLVFGSIAEDFLQHSQCPLLTLSIAPTGSVEYQEKYLG